MNRLSFLLLAASSSLASPTPSPPPSPEHILNPRQDQNANLLGHPIYSSGPYTFVSCNAQQGPALVDLFTQLGDITNTQLMPASLTPTQNPAQDRFPVFFKDNARHDINSAFHGMLGAPLYNAPGGQVTNKRPKIVCLNDDVPELARALEVCSQGIDPVPFTVDEGGSTVVFLCPAFFGELPVLPTKEVDCPSVDASADPTTFTTHNNAVQNQISVIVHQLIHAYLYAALNPTYPATETYPLNSIIALDQVHQYWNANNYAYYAACVYVGCTSFPTSPTQQQPAQPQTTTTSKTKKRQSQSGNASTDIVPSIVDAYPYYIGLDLVALEKNLTGLGYLP